MHDARGSSNDRPMRNIDLVQEDGLFLAKIPIKDDARYRIIAIDIKKSQATISGVSKHISNLIPINKAYYNQKKSEMTDAISSALVPLFDKASLPKGERDNVVGGLVDRLLQIADIRAEQPQAWTERVAAKKPAPAQMTKPDKAPALWRDARLPGERPPDFIKRHYGPWLRSDTTGLTRPDLMRLDQPLYVALAGWLRRHELPEDCPLPSKSEMVDAALAMSGDDRSSLTAKEFWRVQSALRTRGRENS